MNAAQPDRTFSQIRLDPRHLKAVAHPLRARMLAALRLDGPATATQLAERFSTNTGQTSYHLRQLGDVGLVEEDAGRGNGRERWWRSIHSSSQVRRQDLDDPATREQLRWLVTEAVQLQDRALARWLDEQTDAPRVWQDAADVSDWIFRLGPGQLQALSAEVGALLRRWADVESEASAERVLVLFRAFPAPDVDLT